MEALGEHAFVRKGNKRFPIHKLRGSAFPAEMVEEQSNAAFEQIVATELPTRLMIEVNAVLAGRAPAG
jgi:hypothetical protein